MFTYTHTCITNNHPMQVDVKKTKRDMGFNILTYPNSSWKIAIFAIILRIFTYVNHKFKPNVGQYSIHHTCMGKGLEKKNGSYYAMGGKPLSQPQFWEACLENQRTPGRPASREDWTFGCQNIWHYFEQWSFHLVWVVLCWGLYYPVT